MPRSADDDYWSKFALPVAGLVGVTRSDRVQRADVRFRIALSKADYVLVVNKVRTLSKIWTDDELVVHNCNNFVSGIASSLNLRTPLISVTSPSCRRSMSRSRPRDLPRRIFSCTAHCLRRPSVRRVGSID